MKMRGGKSRKFDFHLNIVPIIDCLTILITFMLASGVYLSIGLLPVGVAAPGESLKEQTNLHPIKIDVEMKLDHSFLIKVKGTSVPEKRIAASADYWNMPEMVQTLTGLNQSLPKLEQLTLIASKEISYQQVIDAMQNMKKSIPKLEVQLGGF